MTDDSEIVCRWEIDGATAALDKAESNVFKEEGFEWKAGFQPAVNRTWSNDLDGTLTCVYPGGRDWSCEINLKCVAKHKDKDQQNNMMTTKFEYGCGPLTIPNMLRSEFLRDANNAYHFDGKVIIEFHINVTNSQSPPIIDLTKFAANGMGNVVLAIGDKKVKVSKEFLAIHSPVFAAMFFGDYAEKGKEEVEIKDVAYEEFLDLLQLIYLRTVNITDRTVSHILKLADRFQIESVVDLTAKHLTESTAFDTAQKLLLADTYRLDSLRDHCLQSITSVADMTAKLNNLLFNFNASQSSHEYANLSADMKGSICDRIMKLSLQ